jgi:hypothetical protein
VVFDKGQKMKIVTFYVKAVAGVFLALCCVASYAALGTFPLTGANAHVTANAMAAMQTAQSSQAGTGITNAAYRVNNVTLDSGTVVREFVSTVNNTVFALTWAGPAKPNLREILGDSFTRFVAPSGSEPGLKIGGPSQRELSSSDLVIRSYGHPGNFRGYAYLPAQVPAGVSLSSLQ